MSKDIEIDGQVFKVGQNGVVRLTVGRLPSDTEISIDAHVFRSKIEGPSVLILAGVHGDEINGIEIVRRFLHGNSLGSMQAGSIIVIPLLNVFGFINFNRYVPDGKDVNRSFPGTMNGSLASRIARTLTKFILPNVDYIFDFHTGGDSRFNYPQIRVSKLDYEAMELAKAFDSPMIIHAGTIPKSLRRIAQDFGATTIIYEGGESVRLSQLAIDRGLQGLLNCLSYLGIMPANFKQTKEHEEKVLIRKTSWLRAGHSGIFIWTHCSGMKVKKGEKIGTINDPYGLKSISVICHRNGYIIGHNNASVVNHGDALFHIGYESEVL
ncbi:succinylglutamate desuccinylase/aspartoacylase family protein [bacterium]|nr:succinylglutamate desuccinylase/aspartoacylase family protein [bacterium]